MTSELVCSPAVFRIAVVAVAALLSTSCAHDQAKVTIRANLPQPLRVDMLTVKIDDGRQVRTLTGADFKLLGGNQHRGPTLGTSTHGTLIVSYSLRSSASLSDVSSGQIELPLRKDWTYGVDVLADTADPRRLCFGCQGSKAFSLAPDFRSPLADSVYVVWGGNSISHPVIY